MRRRSVLFRWFVSYLIILIIPMLLSMVIYTYSYRFITRTTGEIYAASLERSRTEIDSMVSTVFQTLDYLTLNGNVVKLSFLRGKPSPGEHWAIIQLVKDLQNFSALSPFLDDVFVVLNETGTIVSTIGYIDEGLFYRLNYQSGDLDFEDFRTLMENLHRDQDAYPAGDYFLFLKTTLESDSSRNSITVAAAVKRSRFEEHFIRENGTRMYIEDPGRNLEYFAPGATGNSESCRRLASPSRVLNWRYVCLLPDSAQKETARKIQLITLAGLAISSLLCLPLSFVLSKKNYEPVRKLISYFRSSEKNDDPRENEFLWLQERTGEFLKENRETRKAIQKYYAQSWYSRETEQKLLNLVRAGDGGEAAALVRRTFESINFPEELSGTMKRLLAYDLLGILVRGIHQDGEELLDEFGIEEISPADLPAFMEKTVLSACEDRQRILQNKNNRVLCEKAKNYINENYHNPSLNISQTGYSLGISPFYLSSIFREETGQSLLEYINTRRIDEGKRLLEEGRGLAEIAEMTGFRGSGAFIRVFKKLAGITPGQYKKTS